MTVRSLLLPLLAALLLGNDAPTLSLDALKQGDTAALAARLLPPEMAGQAFAHEILPPYLSLGPPAGIRFFGHARASGDHLCARTVFLVPLRWASNADGEPIPDVLEAAAPATARDQIALGDSCAAEAGLRYADIRAMSAGEAATLLHGLIALQAALKAGRAPSVPVRCRSDLAMGACDPDAARVFAGLPLDAMASLDRPETGERPWRVIIADGPEGAPVWMVDVLGAPGAPSAIALARTQPF